MEPSVCVLQLASSHVLNTVFKVGTSADRFPQAKHLGEKKLCVPDVIFFLGLLAPVWR